MRGRFELYVRDMSGLGAVALSNSGGEEPHWSRDGRELYYRSGNRLVVAPGESGAALTEMKRRTLAAQVDAADREAHRPAWGDLERTMRHRLTEWRSLLAGETADARAGFRKLLTTPILCTPFVEKGRRGIRVEGRIGLGALVGEVVTEVTSPRDMNKVDRVGGLFRRAAA
jgi:hypothetical protein